MHTRIRLRSDILIIPQNTEIFAALQESENGFSKIMPSKPALLYELRVDEKFFFDLLCAAVSISTQIQSQARPSLVFGACGGLSGFLAGIFGIGGVAGGLFMQSGYCPGF